MSLIQTKIENFTLRFAEEKDVSLILEFIKDLAEYEKLSNEVVATEAILKESLFDRKMAEVIIGEFAGEPVCFALFCHNFSTFLGKPGIHLEDLYVKPQMRGKGFGKTVLSFLSELAIKRDCGRFEWACLDWNKPSIQFYKNLNAEPMEDWTIYRLTDQNLKELAKEFKED